MKAALRSLAGLIVLGASSFGATLNLSTSSSSLSVGESVIITENLSFGTQTSVENISSVIGFDPNIFTIVNFQTPYSYDLVPSYQPNAMGYYYFDILGGHIWPAGTWLLATFTLTAIAPADSSPVLIAATDGTHETYLSVGGPHIPLTPPPSNSYDRSIDQLIKVTSSTPEPMMLLPAGIALTGVILARGGNRRRKTAA